MIVAASAASMALFGLAIGASLGLEGGGAVLEKLLLPTTDRRGLQPKLITELGNRLLFQQMPPQNGDLLFSRVSWLDNA
ncbi:MAG: hypothetical protein ABSH45_21125 [Bryobacteraceae bacterium]|jgi:hypothetical protein